MSVGVLECFIMKQSKLTWFYVLLWFGCMSLLGQKSLPGAAGASLARGEYSASKN